MFTYNLKLLVTKSGWRDEISSSSNPEPTPSLYEFQCPVPFLLRCPSTPILRTISWKVMEPMRRNSVEEEKDHLCTEGVSERGIHSHRLYGIHELFIKKKKIRIRTHLTYWFPRGKPRHKRFSYFIVHIPNSFLMVWVLPLESPRTGFTTFRGFTFWQVGTQKPLGYFDTSL